MIALYRNVVRQENSAFIPGLEQVNHCTVALLAKANPDGELTRA